MATWEPPPSSVAVACRYLARAAAQWQNEYDTIREIPDDEAGITCDANTITLTFHDGKRYVFTCEERADETA